MSTLLVELLALATAATHTIELDLPRVELRLELTDPRTNAPIPLPAGPMVSLVSDAGVVLDRAAIEADGCVHLLGDPAATDVRIEIDLGGAPWLDLGARAWVANADATDVRPLLRLPRRWRSDEQASFSDDRGGTFALGVLAMLTDGALGTADAPWVLRIDHGWPRRVLELRYSNTRTGTQLPLPRGVQVEAAYDVGAPKLRLAGASCVLDARGTIALWIFDRGAPLGDLRVLLRSAPGSHIEMDEPDAIVQLSDAELRRRTAKARARLHPLPKTLRLHEQPAQQGALRGVLGPLLPKAAAAPARIVVPIDVLVELRLVLFDPASGTTKPLPADVEVHLTDARDRAIATSRTGEDGRATLFAPPGTRELAIEVAFADTPWLDLVDAKLVDTEAAAPNTKRRLIRLPERWRSTEQSRLSDDRGGKVVSGRLASLDDVELGTIGNPWELDLGHAWQRTELVFQHYDVTARAVRPLPFGALVEAFDDARLRDRDLVGAGTVLDADGRVHVMCWRRVDPGKLRIRMRTAPGSVVVTNETDPELRMRTVGDTALAAMTVADRQRHYPLPSVWLTRGQATRTSDATSSPAQLFEDAIGAALSTDVLPPRLYFDLDDFVLVNRAGLPLRFVRALDLTLFHHDMSIRAPVAGQPYFSAIAAEHNHFAGNAAGYTVGSGAEKTTRVVRRGTTFYDLGEARTTRGRLVGVRAAVAQDHPHERVYLKHQPGTSPNLANCDLHYFADVASDPTKPDRSISVLMVFFSVRIRDVGTGTVDQLQEALGRAAERWSGAPLSGVLAGTTPDVPDVRLRTDDDKHDIKYVFHFPAFDDREGHAVIWIRKKPRAFSLSTFGLIVIAHADSNAGGAAPGVEYGHAYPSETIAHELGHSMGLGDEYFESFSPGIPSVRQFAWDFLHFSFDRHSMMFGEFAPRLRHYWVFSRWLERCAEIAGVRSNGYAIVCDTAAVTAPVAGRQHAFRLPSEHAWPYAPVREAPRFRPGRGGRGELRLFLLGDELDVFRLPHSGVLAGVDAVLHWDLAIYVRGRKNADGAAMSEAAVAAYVSSLFRDTASAMGGVNAGGVATRCLVAELDPSAAMTTLAQHHVKKVLIYLLPRFTTANPAAADFRVHVRQRASTPDGDVTDLHDPGFEGRKIEVHEGLPGAAILRCMMGIGAAAARPGAKVTITTAPFPSHGWVSIGTNHLTSVGFKAVSGPRTPGSKNFDGSGTPAQIAADLAAAIDDPANGLASDVRATASGATVSLTAEQPGADVNLAGAAVGIQHEWRDEIEPSELDFLADWLGTELGATYRIKAYD